MLSFECPVVVVVVVVVAVVVVVVVAVVVVQVCAAVVVAASCNVAPLWLPLSQPASGVCLELELAPPAPPTPESAPLATLSCSRRPVWPRTTQCCCCCCSSGRLRGTPVASSRLVHRPAMWWPLAALEAVGRIGAKTRWLCRRAQPRPSEPEANRRGMLLLFTRYVVALVVGDI